MSPSEYVEQRLEHQIGWYGQKSQHAQGAFKWLRGAELSCAASIPFLAGFANAHPALPLLIGLLGAVTVVLAGFQSLGQYQEHWLEYRTTCESLKHEKYLYLTECPPYDRNDRFALLVDRVETLISKENSSWSLKRREASQAGSRPAGTTAAEPGSPNAKR